MTADTSLPALIVIAAVVVIKTVIADLRRPGSTRREWAFATDSSAVAGGAAASAAIIWPGWSHAGTVAVASALLVGALTAHLIHHHRQCP
ncbi:hypothetical protein ACIHAR_28980 [Streptomyces sp. NPDC052016]|uniref:hypothetical protein n=1 Tax=Streptomyces sp. NPDC052016 TaxID=3365680 RepID=UPI0037D333BF